MALLSSFSGILIYIYLEKIGKHKTPHIHAGYAEFEMSIDFDGNILAGELPNNKRKLVEAWIVLHSEELKAAWKAYHEFGEVIKIKGLE